MMRDWFAPPKKPSSVLGLVVCYSLLAVGTFGLAYFLVGPIVPFKVGAIITIVVLAPGVTLGIVRQIRLRRALSAKISN
jgi:hypothetical protein